ncbi:MAG: glycerol-3-phosphate acyltransferase [Chloroflexi bacterium]|nr:glycerol-3-phosphate acyltransferase [Chloroflexota bacterium]MBP8054293.1 glycerol-3-phosphate acyltransferase [Chloroflexota bacterium]
MSNTLIFILAGLIGYVFGSIPFGFLFVRLVKRIDLRDVGSGRTGGTNSMRAAGPVVGALTGLSDVLKGASAIWIARLLFSRVLNVELLPWAEMLCGIGTIMGHNWSIFLGFKGGAGTGPNIGWATAIWWPMFPIGVLTVVGIIVTVGMASIASLSMGAIIPLVFAIRYATEKDTTPAYLVGGLITLVIVSWALRPNIKRLLDGSERIVGPRARRKEAKAAGNR